jgi:signal transduction histidine kinase
LKRLLAIAALSAGVVGVLAYAGIFSSLATANYLPHRYCYLAQPGLIWTNVVTDGLIAGSYALIFGCLFWVAAKLRWIPAIHDYLWIFFAFGSFILACGATHAMEIVTVWWPVYRLSAAVKVICAAASVPTAILFARVTPALAGNVRRFIDMLSTSQEEREQAMRALIASEKLAVAGRISATISHEVKNPLQTAGDMLYLLVQDGRIPADAARMLESAAAELERAKTISESTLSLYRESASPATISLSELIQSVLELQLPDLARRRISLQPRLRTPRPLKGYSGELRQMLINLIQNAAAAVEANGRILVRVQPRSSLTPGTALAGYSITVADNGPGIEARNRPRLFTLFFTTKGEQGTGLGLWLVRSIVEKQGGRIRVRSRTAEESGMPGAIFNIWIPLEPAPIAAAADGNGFTPVSGGARMQRRA